MSEKKGGTCMKKKIVSMFLCGAMAASLLAGCGSQGGDSKEGGDTGNDSAGGKQEVVIWDYFETDAQKQMMEDLISGFNQSQDKYEAKHTYVPFADYEKRLQHGFLYFHGFIRRCF